VIHQRTNIFVWPELSAISDGNSAEGTLFFALSVVGFDAVGAESVEAAFVNHRAADHFLANGTSEIFHHALNKPRCDCVVEY
jgi:hypothetical protein